MSVTVPPSAVPGKPPVQPRHVTRAPQPSGELYFRVDEIGYMQQVVPYSESSAHSGKSVRFPNDGNGNTRFRVSNDEHYRQIITAMKDATDAKIKEGFERGLHARDEARSYITLFGRTMDGRSVYAQLPVPLTMVLELPSTLGTEWDAKQVLQCLSQDLDITLQPNDWSFTMKHRANGWVPDEKDRTKPKKFPILTLRFHTMHLYNRALQYFRDGTYTVGRRREVLPANLQDSSGRKFEVSVWETTDYIKATDRFSLETRVYTGNWLKLTEFRHLPWEMTHCDVQVSTTMRHLVPDLQTQDMGPSVFMCWDIECISCADMAERQRMREQGLDKFPNASDETNAIIMISQTFHLADGRVVRMLLQLGDREAYEERMVRGQPYTVVYFTSELDMLLHFRDLLVYYDPDVLMSYNGDGFDYPYLLARFADRIGCYTDSTITPQGFLPSFSAKSGNGKRFYQWSRFRNEFMNTMKCPVDQATGLPVVGSVDSEDKRNQKAFPIWVVAAQRGAIIVPKARRVACDMLTVVRALGKSDKTYAFTNFTLQAVANRFLGVTKVDFDYNDIFDAWVGCLTVGRFGEIVDKESSGAVSAWVQTLTGRTLDEWAATAPADAPMDALAARRLLGDYCVIDTELPLQILEKMGLWHFFMELARVTRCSVNDIINSGQMRRASIMFVDESWRQGRYVNIPEIFAPYRYQGATVLQPKRGYYGGYHPSDAQRAKARAMAARVHRSTVAAYEPTDQEPSAAAGSAAAGSAAAAAADDDDDDDGFTDIQPVDMLLHSLTASREELVAALPAEYDWSDFTDDELRQWVEGYHVCTLDYKSLYPSIMQELCLCTSTRLAHEQPPSRAEQWAVRHKAANALALRQKDKSSHVLLLGSPEPDRPRGHLDLGSPGASAGECTTPLGLGDRASPMYKNAGVLMSQIRALRTTVAGMKAQQARSPARGPQVQQIEQLEEEIAVYEEHLRVVQAREADPNMVYAQELADLQAHLAALEGQTKTLTNIYSMYRIQCHIARVRAAASPAMPVELQALDTADRVRDAIALIQMRRNLPEATKYVRRTLEKGTLASDAEYRDLVARLETATSLGPLSPEDADADVAFLQGRLARAADAVSAGAAGQGQAAPHAGVAGPGDDADGDEDGEGGAKEDVLRDDDQSGVVENLPDRDDYTTVCVEDNDGSRRYHKYTKHDPLGVYPAIVRRLLTDRVFYKKLMKQVEVALETLRAIFGDLDAAHAPTGDIDAQAHKADLDELYALAKKHASNRDMRLQEIRAWTERHAAWVLVATVALVAYLETTIKILDGRQLALKVCANSCYGVSGAKVRSPCASCEIAESVTARGRQMIKMSRDCAEYRFARFGCVVVYGDTDSIMVLIWHPDARKAWAVGEMISEYITKTLLGGKVHVLELEEDKRAMALFGRKMYVAFSHEGPDRDGSVVQKGIAVVRRDRAAVLTNLMRQLIKAITDLRRLPVQSIARQLLLLTITHLEKMVGNAFPVSDYVICKRINKMGEGGKAKSPHLTMAERMSQRTGRPVMRGDSVNFVFVHRPTERLASARVEAPSMLAKQGERVDRLYYLQKQIRNVVSSMLRLFLPDELIDTMFDKYEFVLKNPSQTSIHRAMTGRADITPAMERRAALLKDFKTAVFNRRLPIRSTEPEAVAAHPVRKAQTMSIEKMMAKSAMDVDPAQAERRAAMQLEADSQAVARLVASRPAIAGMSAPSAVLGSNGSSSARGGSGGSGGARGGSGGSGGARGGSGGSGGARGGFGGARGGSGGARGGSGGARGRGKALVKVTSITDWFKPK
jgi:DNA polymerase elongation subunit (family B)